jgi:hypothetical protein
MMRNLIESMLLAFVVYLLSINYTISLTPKLIFIFLSIYVILNNSSFFVVQKFLKNKPDIKGMIVMVFGVFKMIFCLSLFFILFKKHPELIRKEYILFFASSYFSFMLLYVLQAKRILPK